MANEFDRIFKEESEILIKELDESGLKLEKHLVQLEIISDLCNMQPLLTKIMETMSITYDIHKDVRFKQGNQEGKKEEALIKSQEFIITLLQNSTYPIDTIANLVKVTVDFVQKTKAGYEKALLMLQDESNTAQKIATETGLMLEVVQDLKKQFVLP